MSTSPHSAAPRAAPPLTVEGKRPLRYRPSLTGWTRPSPSIHRSPSSTYDSLRHGPPKGACTRPPQIPSRRRHLCEPPHRTHRRQLRPLRLPILSLAPSLPRKPHEGDVSSPLEPAEAPRNVTTAFTLLRPYSRQYQTSSPRCRAAYVHRILRKRASAIKVQHPKVPWVGPGNKRQIHEDRQASETRVAHLGVRRDHISDVGCANLHHSTTRSIKRCTYHTSQDSNVPNIAGGLSSRCGMFSRPLSQLALISHFLCLEVIYHRHLATLPCPNKTLDD
jgi:hypothetical protein